MKTVAIVGLGYVGLPLACLCAQKGFRVIGLDVDERKITLLKQGKSPLDDAYVKQELKKVALKLEVTTKASKALKNADIVVICVPTPIDQEYHPDLRALKSACESVSSHLKNNALVIIESTIFPATTEEIVFPILNKSGTSFFLAHCPERIDPGNKKYTIRNLPRVLAGIDEASVKKAKEFYSKIIEAPITALSSLKAAEATKIMENTFRDVNIAFVNEMAKSFDKAGIDILEVIKGASTKPFAFMPHYPGAGVGGHCIGVDPYYLIAKAKQLGFNHEFVSLARKINNSMPAYTVELLEEEVRKQGKKVAGSKVGVLGIAYKGGVDDMRESPALDIIAILRKKHAQVEAYDPYISGESTSPNVVELLKKCDYVIIATDHQEFIKIDPVLLKQQGIKIVIDGKNCLDKNKVASLGISYHGIGRSSFLQRMKMISQCDLCGATKFKFLFTGFDKMYNASGYYKVNECVNCGLVFLNPQPSSQELEKHYPSEKYYSLQSKGQPAVEKYLHELFYKRRGNVLLRLLFSPLKPFVRSTKVVKGGKILDVGCGSGHFLLHMKALGMDCYGVEPGAYDAKLAKKNGLHIINSTLQEAGFKENQFDVITLNHVFEHVPNPKETLQEVFRILKPGGTAVIATPQKRSLAHFLFGKYWVQLDIPRHLFTFSTKHLKKYATITGFRIKKVRYNSLPFQFLGSLLYVVNEFRKKPKFLSEKSFRNSKILFFLFLPLAHLCNALKIGDQVEIILQKP